MVVLRRIDALQPADVVRMSHGGDDAPLVTVVVPMLNASAFLERCIKGVLAQTHGNLEVFCVDDHSDDDTYERTVALFGKDVRVSVVRLSRTVGPFQIKNWVVSHLSKAAFVAMQDADDTSHPGRIAIQLAFLAQTGAEVCGTCVHQSFLPKTPPRFSEPWVPVEGNAGWYQSLAVYRSVPRCWTAAPFAEILGEDRQFHFVKHGSQLFRRSLLVRFGGFDGRTRVGADLDLNWRLLRFVPMPNLAEVLYWRRHHDASLTRHPETRFGSPLRETYRLRRLRQQEAIWRAVAAGDEERVRLLCTQDFYCADVEVERAHLPRNTSLH
jgi:glycosyltransferase involved in cell wall biosynthesis